MKDGFKINCNYAHHERDADYTTRDMVARLWQPATREDMAGFCSNLNAMFVDNKCAIDGRGGLGQEGVYMYQQIPSALLLYRLACTFECSADIAGPSGYKVVWRVVLKHKESGEYLGLSEWKGAAGFWTRFMSIEDARKVPLFIEHTEMLLSYLCGPRCAHPYDGLVAGGVA